MPRLITVDLVDGVGNRRGTLPPYPVESPWWQETAPVVAAAWERYGVRIRVLHLITGTPDDSAAPTVGGTVRYVAELLGGTGSEPNKDPNKDEDETEPLRPVWARPGGIARILAWAEPVLRELGRARIGEVEQIRAWNLSSILRLNTETGPVWCKSVPEFFAHEGPVIRALTAIAPSGLLPRLLAHDPATHTVLLDHIPGVDCYDCDEPTMVAMIQLLTELQHRTVPHLRELRGIGLPDWRAAEFCKKARSLCDRTDVDQPPALAGLVAGLPDRFTELNECWLPDTLVHGDPFPGNWRSDGRNPVLLDWGDCGIGHPALDFLAFTERISDAAVRGRLLDTFIAEWRVRRPDSDPAAAVRIAEPIAALRHALVYQSFLDGIEPAERVYHEADVPSWLRRAIGGPAEP